MVSVDGYAGFCFLVPTSHKYQFRFQIMPSSMFQTDFYGPLLFDIFFYIYVCLCMCVGFVYCTVTDRTEIKSHVGRNGTNQKAFGNEILWLTWTRMTCPNPKVRDTDNNCKYFSSWASQYLLWKWQTELHANNLYVLYV